MPAIKGRAPAPWRAIAIRQHLLLWHSGRVALLFAAGLVNLLVVELITTMQAVESMNGLVGISDRAPALGFTFGMLVLMAPLWALYVWRSEARGLRAYHWSLPVPRARHDLWRVVAGATWLVATIIAIAGAGLLVAWYGGTRQLFDYGPTYWVNLVTFPLFMYLLSASLPLLTKRPAAWGIGLAAGLSAFAVLVDGFRGYAFSRFMRGLVDLKYGFSAAMLGGADYARLHAAGISPSDVLQPPPMPAEFLIAATLWIAAVAVIVGVAARRSPP